MARSGFRDKFDDEHFAMHCRNMKLPHTSSGYIKFPAGFEWDSYDGSWVNYRPEGYGCLVRKVARLPAQQLKYEGEFRGGNRHGKGKAEYHDGHEYDGQWANDLPNGWGTWIFPMIDDYLEYHGHVTAGQFHWNGVLKFKTGVSYEGGFKNDKYHGNGILKNKNGVAERLGYWQDGKFFRDSMHPPTEQKSTLPFATFRHLFLRDARGIPRGLNFAADFPELAGSKETHFNPPLDAKAGKESSSAGGSKCVDKQTLSKPCENEAERKKTEDAWKEVSSLARSIGKRKRK